MTRLLTLMVCLSLSFIGCQKTHRPLPQITHQDIVQADEIEMTLQREITQGDLVVALENQSDLTQKGAQLDRLIERLIRLILPDHLENFNQDLTRLNGEMKPFAQYQGVHGRCHQFRVFYPYKDTRVENVQWASSILSLPRKRVRHSQGGVVLAPTLDGFTPFIEAGLWLKMCRRGLATLMPESLYRRKSLQWQKLHFDPTPELNQVDEFELYEQSIVRYENVLNINLGLLRNINNIETDRGAPLANLNVMNVRPDRVGFWGSSFGAVVGSIVVAKDPRIKAAVLTVGGGNLPYIVAHSKISLFEYTRAEQMKILGIKSVNEYQKFIANYLDSDPLDHAKPSDAKRLYMILARKDESVPTVSQYQLHKQFGSPSHSRIHSGHVGALLFTSWFHSTVSQKSIDSLLNNLQKN